MRVDFVAKTDDGALRTRKPHAIHGDTKRQRIRMFKRYVQIRNR